MRSISALSDPEIRRIFLKLKEHGWPTSNYLNNVDGINLIPMSQEEVDEIYHRSDIEQLLRNNIFYIPGNETFLRRELIRCAHSKTMYMLPDDYRKLVDNDYSLFKYPSVMGFERYAVNYFASELFLNEYELFDAYQISPNRTTIMGAIINTIGIEKFAKMFFTGDNHCLTTEILNKLGEDFTKELLDYFSIYNSDDDDYVIEDFFHYLNKFLYYLPGNVYIDEVIEKYKKYQDYQNEKIRSLGKNIIPFRD